MSWLSLGVSCLIAIVLCLRFMLGGGRFDILYSMRLAAFLFSFVHFILIDSCSFSVMKDSNRSGYFGRAAAASNVRKEYWLSSFLER